MSLFANLSGEGLEESQDRLGGFSPLDTAIYKAVIKAFYAGASDSGAMNITILADVGGKEYRETIYITNKEGKRVWITGGKEYASLAEVNDALKVQQAG